MCAFALKQVKYQTESTHIRRKISSPVVRGLEVKRARKTKVDVLKSAHMFRKRKTSSKEKPKSIEKHVTIISKHGHEKTKHADDVNNPEQTVNAHAESLAEHAESANVLVRNANERARNANEHAKERLTDEEMQENITQKGSVDLKQASCNLIKKKRKRSRRFKNMPLDERKRIKTQCIQLLSTL